MNDDSLPRRVTRSGRHPGGKDLLPGALPDDWMILERRDSEHAVLVWFGHRAPVDGVDIIDLSASTALPEEARIGCDFVAHVSIEPKGSPEAAREEQASSNVVHYGGLRQMIRDAIASGDNATIEEVSAKMEQVIASQGEVMDTEYLGEQARGTRAADGLMVLHSTSPVLHACSRTNDSP